CRNIGQKLELRLEGLLCRRVHRLLSGPTVGSIETIGAETIPTLANTVYWTSSRLASVSKKYCECPVAGLTAFKPLPYSPSFRREGSSGPVAAALCDRVHCRRTGLSREDARPSETPQQGA
ncbi:MAG: hypothetical protein R6V61_07595, partial [Wenzhouxiangellaceae bacterium]